MNHNDDSVFQVSHADEKNTVVVRLAGEFDVASSDRLVEYVESLRPLSARLVIDLTDVSFIDSSGLQALVAARRAALDDTGSSVGLRGESSMTTRLLQLTGLDDAFDRSGNRTD